jgi:maltose/moltooligosaccharide transporter
MLAGALPANKMGYYMGVFNFFIVIPQMVAGVTLGFFTKNLFHGATVLTLVLGGVSMIISGLLTLRVDDKDDVRLMPTEDAAAESPAYDTPALPDPRA